MCVAVVGFVRAADRSTRASAAGAVRSACLTKSGGFQPAAFGFGNSRSRLMRHNERRMRALTLSTLCCLVLLLTSCATERHKPISAQLKQQFKAADKNTDEEQIGRAACSGKGGSVS